MSQCVPSWDLDDSPPARLPLRSSRSHSIALHDVPALLDYEVAELTWENGQIAMHGLGPPRVPNKPLTNNTSTTTTNSHACKHAAIATSAWDKPRAGGTLESIVSQATRSSFPHKSSTTSSATASVADELVPWSDHHTAAAMTTNNMDAQVPCSNRTHHQNDVVSRRPAERSACGGGGGCGRVNVGSITRVASCSCAATRDDINNVAAQHMKRTMVAAGGVPQEWSVSGTSGSQQVRMDHQYSCERDFGMAFTSTSLGSPDNASSGKPSTKATTATAADDHDSVCHSRLQASDLEKKPKRKRVYIMYLHFD